MAAVNAADGLPVEEALPVLRKALGNRNNLVVSRAARHVAGLGLAELVPEMVAAFWRFMPGAGDAVKRDPQCWAKNDLSKALAGFDAQEPELFLAGMRHHQMEPTWGGASDTAGALRGACALALVVCREVSSYALLQHLVPLFRDKDTPVRVNAARAVEQVGSDAASLLLRLRVELGSDEPEVLGACLGGVLRIDGETVLPWVGEFLARGDDLAAEAALCWRRIGRRRCCRICRRHMWTGGSRRFAKRWWRRWLRCGSRRLRAGCWNDWAGASATPGMWRKRCGMPSLPRKLWRN